MENEVVSDIQQIKKRPKPTLLIKIILLVVILGVLVFLYFFIGKNILEKKEEKSIGRSVFEEVVDDENENGLEQTFKTPVNPMLTIEDSMGKAFDFLQTNRISKEPGSFSDPEVGYGEIVIEVIETNGAKTYKLLASANPLFKYTVGEEVPFNPIVNPSTFMIQGDNNSVSYMNEIPDFKIPDSLKTGDKVVFICESSDCSDNKVSWGLVYRIY